jgi:hypothetical protein
LNWRIDIISEVKWVKVDYQDASEVAEEEVVDQQGRVYDQAFLLLAAVERESDPVLIVL